MSDRTLSGVSKPDELPAEYYESLGSPTPASWNTDQFYRFDTVKKHLAEGSVLDVGAYYGDFLDLLDEDRDVFGTEINEERVDLANERLGEDVVALDFRNGHLSSFDDDQVENVVCMEVIEHVPDYRFAVTELCRVAEKRVLITVPYSETVRTDLCVHCHQYTPRNGHLHSFDETVMEELVPDAWGITKQFDFASFYVRALARRLPKHRSSYSLLRAAESLTQGMGSWLFVQVDPQGQPST